MNNIFYLTGNILKMIFRKKSNMIVYIILPIVTISILMWITGINNTHKVYMGLVDKDNSNFSKDMITFLEDVDKFEIVYINEEDVNDKIAAGNFDFAFIIPEEFEESVYDGNMKTIEVVSIKGQQATILVEEYVKFYMSNLQDIYTASNGDKQVFDKIYSGYQDGSLKFESQFIEDKVTDKQSTQISMGMFIMFMMIACSMTANLVLKEKHERTFYRICTTPVSSKEYVFANVLTNIFIVFIQVLLILFIVEKVFKFETYVPAVQMLAILMSFSFAAVGIGMLIVSFSNSSATANSLNILIVTPTCMLGGCFWPRNIMPKTLQNLSNFIPQTWAMDAITKVQMGHSFGEIRSNILIILVFAATFFLISIYKMKKNDDVSNFI